MNAIGIKIKKADGNHDPCTSKFFGAPVLPDGWPEMFSEDIIFFGQIRLSDIAELDTENKLPHTGYLYLFLDIEMYPYQGIIMTASRMSLWMISTRRKCSLLI